MQNIVRNNYSLSKNQKLLKQNLHISDSSKKLFKLMVNSQSATLKFKNFKINNLNKFKNRLSEEFKSLYRKNSNIHIKKNSEKLLSVRLSNNNFRVSKTDNNGLKFKIKRNNYFRDDNIEDSFDKQLKMYKFLYSNRLSNHINNNEKIINDDNINIIKNYYFERKTENKERLYYFNVKNRVKNQEKTINYDEYDKREEKYNKLLFPKNNYSISRKFNRDKLTKGISDKSAIVKDSGKKIKYRITGIFRTDSNLMENFDY